MPLRFRVHPVTCAIGCADASIPTREGQRRLSRRVIAGATANEHDRRPASMTPPRSTPLATPLDLRRQRNASDRELALAAPPGLSRRDRTAAGRAEPSSAACRSDSPVRRSGAAGSCSTVRSSSTCARPARPVTSWSPISATPGGTRSRVVRRTCRSAGSRRSASRWPATPWSWRRGASIAGVMRRRFEVNEGIIGWGQGAFAAVAHTIDTPLDWRGPYPAMPVGGYAEPGHAGLLGILPGSWGPAQTGVADSVPSPTGDIALWLHAIEIPDGAGDARRDCGWNRSRRSTRVAASSSRRSRRSAGSPRRLVLEPRRTLRIDGKPGQPGRSTWTSGRCSGTRPAPPPLEATAGSSGRGHRMGDAARGSAVKDGDARRPRDDRRRHDRRRRGSRAGGPPAGRRRAQAVRRRDHRIASDADPPDRRRDRRRDDRGRRCRPASGSRRPTGATSRRWGIATRSTRVSTRTPARTWSSAVRPTPTSRAGFPSSCRTGPSQVEVVRGFGYRPLARSLDIGGDGERDRAPLVLALEPVDGPRRPRLDRGRLPRPLHLADLGAAPGAGRRRGHRQPARDAVGRPPHERRRPPGRRRRRPDRPAHGGHGQREPAEHARSHRPARRLGRGPADGERRSSRRPAWATRSPA